VCVDRRLCVCVWTGGCVWVDRRLCVCVDSGNGRRVSRQAGRRPRPAHIEDRAGVLVVGPAQHCWVPRGMVRVAWRRRVLEVHFGTMRVGSLKLCPQI